MSWLGNLFSAKPNRRDFGKIVSNYLKGHGETKKINFDPARFVIEIVDENGSIVSSNFLENLYNDYMRASRNDRDAVLQGYLTPAPALPKTLHEAIPHVLIRLQPRIFLEGVKAATTNDVASQIPSSIVADYYGASLVFDTPAQLLHLNQTSLTEWGTSLEELLPRAITNLTALTPEPFQRVQEGVYYSHYQDTHDASRLSVMHRVLACQLKGRPVAFMPNRNRLFITGENDVEGLRKVIELIDSVAGEPRPMPVLPIILEGEQLSDWKIWQIPQNHTVAVELARLTLVGLMNTYNIQGEMLQAEYDQSKKEIFAANFIVFESQLNKQAHSLCTLSDGVISSLPHTQFIAVNTGSAEPLFVTFESAREVLGDSLRAQNIHPPRFLLENFPDDERLDALKLKSLDLKTLTPAN